MLLVSIEDVRDARWRFVPARRPYGQRVCFPRRLLKKWMSWAYLKRFLEGGDVPVVGPKNCGVNVLVKSDALLFLAAPQEVAWNWRSINIVSNREPTVVGRIARFTCRQIRTILTFHVLLSILRRFKVVGSWF